jgi:hypothetical protein
MLAAARVVLKQHRFEVTVAAVATICAGGWAFFNLLELAFLAVPPECVQLWTQSGPSDSLDCGGALQAWVNVVESRVMDVMGPLPFAVGLLAGVPIVAREIESQTAPVAWWLYPSRIRWFAAQVVPVMLLIGVCLAFTAVTTSILEESRVLVGSTSPVSDMGRYGPLIIVRALGAFGIGLFVGALLGRTLPALVFGAAVVVATVMLAASARDNWLSQLPPTVVTGFSSTQPVTQKEAAIVTAVAFRTPEGQQISLAEARSIAHRAGAPQPAPGDDQDLPAAQWLYDNGYTELALGVTTETALGWQTYEALIFGVVALVSSAAAAGVVNRRRPT